MKGMMGQSSEQMVLPEAWFAGMEGLFRLQGGVEGLRIWRQSSDVRSLRLNRTGCRLHRVVVVDSRGDRWIRFHDHAVKPVARNGKGTRLRSQASRCNILSCH